MKGEWIEVPAKDGGSFRGLSRAAGGGQRPRHRAVQEIFGVNATMREQADA